MSEHFGGSASEKRTYSQILDDPWIGDEEKRIIRGEATLGHTAMLLIQRGDQDTARLLLDVISVAVEYDDEARDWDLWLEVAPEHRAQFTDDIVTKIREVAVEVSKRRSYGISWICVREILPDVGPDWRDHLREQFSGKRPTNQARRARTEPPRFTEDYLYFTNPGERTVYRALKQIQENLPKEYTIGIYPLAGGRVPGKTWEPDVLVTYRGRAGVLEVDGPNHNVRRAMDITRDHVLMDAGIAFVDRIPVEVLADSADLEAHLRRFLRRLNESK